MSDQDFFFEDEEADAAGKTEAKKPAAKGGTDSKPASKPAAKAAPATAGSFFDQQVSIAVASLIAVVALLVGVIGGFMLGGSGTPGGVPVSTIQTAPGAQTAPQLTPEQLNSGQLPQGHPNVSGAATAGAAGSTAATSGK